MSISPVGFILILLPGLLAIFKFARARYNRVRFQRREHCVKANRMPQGLDIWGIKINLERTKAAKERTVLRREIECHEQYGRTFAFTSMGSNVIRTIDPRNIKALLQTKFTDYSILEARLEHMGPLLGKGIFTNDGQDWNHSRALLRPTFKASQINNMENYSVHVERVLSLIPRNKPVEVQALFARLAFDLSTELLLGESIESLRSSQLGVYDRFAEAFDYSQEQVVKRFRMGKFARFYRNAHCDEAHRIVHDFVDGFIDRALAAHREGTYKPQRYCFLQEMVQQTQDPLEIRSEMLNILLAGRDTTSSALSNALLALAKNPVAWYRLKEDVASLDGKRPDYERLRNLKYVKYVVHEAIRLWPLIPVNARKARQDTVLPTGGGSEGNEPVFVPKATVVRFSTYAMQRDKAIFGDDANEFNPDRFDTLQAGWGFLPFGGGPRTCIGQNFAFNEICYTLIRIVQEFSAIELHDTGEWVELFLITLRNRNPVMIVFKGAEYK